MTCPDEDTLFALVRGGLAPGPAASVAAHADGCEGCQVALGEVARLAAREEPPRAPKPLAPGDEIGDRFRLVERLGGGGAGVVWSAMDRAGSETVALKFLRVATPDQVRRLLREARLAGALRHPNLVTAREVIPVDDRPPVLVMELLRGESLALQIARGALEPDAACAVMAPLADAVAALHALAIVHRDIKPSNVFLVGDSPRLLDLGLAKQLRGGAHTRPTTAGKLLGTPRYMAPEQLVAVGDADERADVWALGAVLYEVLAGKPHVDAHRPAAVMRSLAAGIPPLRALAPRVPERIATLTMQMLRTDRRERPSASAVAAALRA
jgi:serine/threonine protein kinase